MTKRKSSADALAKLAAQLPDAKDLPGAPALEKVQREVIDPIPEPPAERTSPEPEAAPAKKGGPLKQLTLYLNPEAHKALNQLALDLDRRPHSLLIEALNELLVKYGRQAVAVDRRNKGMG